MAAPIFEMLSGLNGQEAALNGVTRARGGAVRAEIFVPVITGRFADRGTPTELQPLEVKPGARVRVTREPYLGRMGTLPREIKTLWTSTDAGTRLPSLEIEWTDASGAPDGDRAIIPWTNLELIG
jgi:hypothetical protein